jgi:glycosyltransferase involved in cell wall biosynthesis
MKTLIIVSPGFPKDERDTTCLPSQQLFVRTVKELFPQLELSVLALQYPYHTKPYQWNGVWVYPLNGKLKRGLFRLVMWFQANRLLKNLTKGKDVVGIITFWCNETALISNQFAKRRNISHKIWICGQDAKADNRWVRWIKPNPSTLVAMSDFLKYEFEKNHKIAVTHTVYNGVANTFTEGTRDVHLIGAASLIPLKQHNIFLEVVAALLKENNNISAVLFGQGQEEVALKKMSAALGLSRNLEFKGEVDHQTLMEWMNRSKILIHPSAYEGYSTVCLEGLANGCKVVSFTKPEDQSIENWHVVKTTEEMIDKVRELLHSDDEAIPVLHRTMEATVHQMINLLQK